MNTFCPKRNIKLATYASRCIENEILMHLRKCQSQKNEISIDEPLNVDWDGNELLLSDVLGTDSDSINRPIEQDVGRASSWTPSTGWGSGSGPSVQLRFGILDVPGADPKGRWQTSSASPNPTYPGWKSGSSNG